MPDEYSTIQSAIDAASDGDEVLVSAGTYVENINFNGKNIALIGEDRETTIIDGNQNGSVVTFVNEESSEARLSNFTITNGNGNGDNYGNHRGGGIACISASPTLDNLIITENSANHNGGGIYLYSSGYSVLTLTNLIINNNEADYNGGGIYIGNTNVTLIDLMISNNEADNTGGGIYFSRNTNYNSTIHDSFILNSSINDNSARFRGGGLYISGWYCNLLLDGLEIRGNEVWNSGTNEGGGIWGSNGILHLSNSVILENRAYEGSGLRFSSTELHLYDVNISNNLPQVSYGSGVGIYCSFVSLFANDLTLIDNEGNVSVGNQNGSEIKLKNSVAIINHLTLADSDLNEIGDIWMSSSSSLTINNSILWENTLSEFFFNCDESCYGIDENNDEPPNVVITYSNLSSDHEGIGNVNENPLFTDPDNGDFTLQPTSPCIDAGDPESELDPDGTIADMGAYYFDQIENPIIYGCMDSEATNYNADATIDDGSCIYNQAPVANDSEVTMDEDYEVTIYLSATDPEEDVLTFSIVDMPVNGSLTISGIAALYIPNTDFNGTDSFTFTANDGMANSNLATVQLTINPVNDPPVLTDEFEDITIYQYDTETIEIDVFYDVDNSLVYSAQTSDVSIASATVVGEILILTGINGGVAEITVSASDGEYEITDSFDIYVENICDLGDVNCDGQLNILDIVIAANMVLADEYDEIADMNEDGELNILDLVIMVNLVLGGEPFICDGLTEVELWGEYYDIGTTTEIELYAQGLTGSIPPEIGCLTNLEYLSLENNQLTGSIPPEIGNLTGLTTLNLWGNQLSGEIPVEIGNLTNLTYLTLTSNQLTGEIPVEIGNLTNLTGLYLGWNQLTGEIPPEIGNLENLTYLYLYFNQLTGEIPSTIGNLTNLTNLFLAENQLTGEIPSEIGQLTNLTSLYLGWNQLTGEIPPEIGNLTNLIYLYLHTNQLSGEIPPEIGNLTNLTYLYLYDNQLTGQIPSEIGQLTNLTKLYLSDNQLTGEIPQAVCDLIESNNLDMPNILEGNNLINTCD